MWIILFLKVIIMFMCQLMAIIPLISSSLLEIFWYPL